jgi:hypothetical protein
VIWCPRWLLKVVIAFLTDRQMIARYKGEKSSMKSLPGGGGGPQGTLLGLFLFLVLINGTGFQGQVNNVGELATRKRNVKAVNLIHLKYVDDLSLAETVNISEKLIHDPDHMQPDTFLARSGHVLPPEDSAVYRQLVKTAVYASNNNMKVNEKKTKLIV